MVTANSTQRGKCMQCGVPTYWQALFQQSLTGPTCINTPDVTWQLCKSRCWLCLLLMASVLCCSAAGCAGGVVLHDNKTGEIKKLPLGGLFFAIGHAPATAFLEGQLALDEYGYIVTAPDSTATNIPGVPGPGGTAAAACVP